MRIIDVEDGPVLKTNSIQFRKRRQLAAHAVNAVDGDDGDSDRRCLVQHFRQGLRIAVREGQTRVPLALAILAPS